MIENAVDESDVAIVLVSADSLTSPFIRDVELPMVFDAQEKGRMRVVPIFVGPIGVLPPEMAEVQVPTRRSTSREDEPCERRDHLCRAGQVAEGACAGAGHVHAATSDDARLSLERIPAAGIVFDRGEIRSQLAKFLQTSPRRMCLVHGFPGIGKTALAAATVESRRTEFVDVLWLTCHKSERSGLVLLRPRSIRSSNGTATPRYASS